MSDPKPATAAATAVLLRDGPTGLETLMLRRNARGMFGGMWVFPGGKVEPDEQGDDDLFAEAPARRAAVRETLEECALLLEPHELTPFSHWLPPPMTPRRFSTWFFLGRAADGDVTVDGGEIHEHEWLAPAEVLTRRDASAVQLAPPTWVTLHDLATFADVEAALAGAASRRPIPRYETHHADVDGTLVLMWHGDAGYDSSDAGVPGARHRLWLHDDRWAFERD